jgi:ASPIC and UnbV
VDQPVARRHQGQPRRRCARVKVVAQTASGPRAIYRTVGPGASFGSQTLRLHVGLGRATAVTSVEVRWPGSDAVQTFRGLKAHEHYRLKEGTVGPILEPLPRFALSHEPPGEHTHSH